MAFNSIQPVFAMTDKWMSLWLTPIWFLGVGVAAGLAVLMLFICLFYVLSKVVPIDKFRRDGSANIAAIGLTLVLGAGLGAYLRLVPTGARIFQDTTGVFQVSEWAMFLAAATIMIAILVWSLIYCSSARFLGELRSLLFEGVGLYMLSTLGTIAALGIGASFLVENPEQAFRSIPELFTVQDKKVQYELAPFDATTFKKIELSYSASALMGIEILSDRRTLIIDGPSVAESRESLLTIDANTLMSWDQKMGVATSPLPMGGQTEIYVQNQEVDPAKLTIRLISAPRTREALTFVLVALFVTVFGLLFMLMQAVAPKATAIALSASKSELSQPLPILLMVIVGMAIVLFVFMPFHTLGEDIKLLKDCGVTLILIATTFQAVWSASTSVNDEIEGRTALTLLSKPIHRRSFIIGKIMGVVCIILLMFMVLGSIELLAVAYKPIVDARESSLEDPTWQQCHNEMIQTIPGLALAFFQATVLGAFAVALGTRFSLIANFSICFSIYLIGHLTPTIVASAKGGLELVDFFSQLISALVPNLSNFSMEAAIDADVGIPWSVLASVLIYTTIYGVVATLLGLLLFEDRDLA
jgi:hypothetical protein